MKSNFGRTVFNKCLIALLIAIACVLSQEETSMAERFASEGGMVSYNAGEQDYSSLSGPIRSYLYVNDDNTLTRVEQSGSEIVYENYNDNFKLISKGSIKKELELFGGFYAGENANFLVFGQRNEDESENIEVFRVVKYSKDWVRIGSCSLYDCNTTEPFSAGSLRFAESGNMLYIRTSHKMYKSSDGLNHQANLTMSVDTSSMTITDSLYDVMNVGYGYVSHSFNQYIKVNDKELLAVDHGDAYPRAVVLIKYNQPAGEATFVGECSYINLLKFPGRIGANYTGGSVGGFEISDSSYLVAGNYDNTDSDLRNIFLSVTPQGEFEDGNTRLFYITSYNKDSSISVSTPQMVKINDDRFMILWEGFNRASGKSDVYYIIVNGKGANVTKVNKVRGRLSDCQPIIYKNMVTWYYTEDNSPVFCTLPTDGSEPNDNLIKGDVTTIKNNIYSVIKSTDKTKTVAVIDFADYSVE